MLPSLLRILSKDSEVISGRDFPLLIKSNLKCYPYGVLKMNPLKKVSKKTNNKTCISGLSTIPFQATVFFKKVKLKLSEVSYLIFFW